MVLFDADYPYPKVYPDFCYQKSIRAVLSGGLLEMGNWVAYEYYSIVSLDFPDHLRLSLDKCAHCFYRSTQVRIGKMDVIRIFGMVYLVPYIFCQCELLITSRSVT